MWNAASHAERRVAFRVEGDGADVRPVAGVAGPARRVTLLGLEVERVPSHQDRPVIAGMALLRNDVADRRAPGCRR